MTLRVDVKPELFRWARQRAGIDPDTGAIDFGDDASEYARDGQYDDPRFTGPGTA